MFALDQLRSVPIFNSLDDAHLVQVAALAEELRFSNGDTIFAEDDPGDYLFVIIEGRVRLSKLIPNIGEEALSIAEQGDHFGEMALIDGAPRSAHAIAHSDVVLAAIHREAFEQLLFVNRDLAHDVLWSFVRAMSKRLRDTNEKIKTFFTLSGGF